MVGLVVLVMLVRLVVIRLLTGTVGTEQRSTKSLLVKYRYIARRSEMVRNVLKRNMNEWQVQQFECSAVEA